ncbi:hypothetical protein AB0K16_22400 [Nonomuraea jabiensis]|uniref:hypothetical protein n=1 Tax=Nonomuraea jabiensis TaxID=882448 RepID=UPI00341F78C9
MRTPALFSNLPVLRFKNSSRWIWSALFRPPLRMNPTWRLGWTVPVDPVSVAAKRGFSWHVFPVVVIATKMCPAAPGTSMTWMTRSWKTTMKMLRRSGLAGAVAAGPLGDLPVLLAVVGVMRMLMMRTRRSVRVAPVASVMQMMRKRSGLVGRQVALAARAMKRLRRSGLAGLLTVVGVGARPAAGGLWRVAGVA